MPNKPSVVPTWATSTTTPPNKLVPPPQKTLTGWAAAEKPPFEYFNWWMNLVGNWLTYVNQLAASDLSVSFAGGTTTVQAAISELETRSGRMFSGPSGGIVIGGTAWPNAALQDLTIGTQTLKPYSPSNPSGYTHEGLECRNLTINGALTVEGIRSMFVLRVHGNLTLNGDLMFQADPSCPASGLNMQLLVQSPPFVNTDTTYYGNDANTYTSGTYGGSGVVGAGGTFEVRSSTYAMQYIPGASDPTRSAIPGGGLFPRVDGSLTYTGLADYCCQAGLSSEPRAAATWLLGGGQAGGRCLDANNAEKYAEAGGCALVLVSGDIVIASNNLPTISCTGRMGGWALPPPTLPNRVGGGGGGGGALFVYCGGQIRYLAQPHRAFHASGGSGGRGSSYGGSGGGGGLVFLCARNADASVHARADGGSAGRLSGTNAASGNPGSHGRVVAIKNIPSLLL